MLVPKAMRPLIAPLSLRLGLSTTSRSCLLHFFTTTTSLAAKPLPPRPIIPETDIQESFLKGSGPGGQKINKTSSAVQLKHVPTGIVIKCQETRSRSQNRKIARRILGERVEESVLGDGARTAIKEREKGRKKASGEKKRRRKYKRLAEDQGKGVEEEDDDGDDGDDGEGNGEERTDEGAIGVDSDGRPEGAKRAAVPRRNPTAEEDLDASAKGISVDHAPTHRDKG